MLYAKTPARSEGMLRMRALMAFCVASGVAGVGDVGAALAGCWAARISSSLQICKPLAQCMSISTSSASGNPDRISEVKMRSPGTARHRACVAHAASPHTAGHPIHTLGIPRSDTAPWQHQARQLHGSSSARQQHASFTRPTAQATELPVISCCACFHPH